MGVPRHAPTLPLVEHSVPRPVAIKRAPAKGPDAFDAARAVRRWPLVNDVLRQRPVEMIKHYRNLVHAFLEGRKLHQEKWLSMPFPANAPYVAQVIVRAQAMKAQLLDLGRPTDAAFADRVIERAERVREAGYPYYGGFLIPWDFANFAGLYDVILAGHEGKRTDRDMPVDLARLRASKAGLALDLALDGKLFGSAGDLAALNHAQKTGATKLALLNTHIGLYRVPRDAPYLGQLRDNLRLAEQWNTLLELTQSAATAGIAPLLEPHLSLYVRAMESLHIDPATGHVSMDGAAWAQLHQATPGALDRAPLGWTGPFDGQEDGLLQLVPAAVRGKQVIMPMFGAMKDGNIAAAFALRVAPIGNTVRRDPHENYDPPQFLSHDALHILFDPGVPLEQWEADGPALRRAMVRLFGSIDRHDKLVFGLVHEARGSITEDPRIKRFLPARLVEKRVT